MKRVSKLELHTTCAFCHAVAGEPCRSPSGDKADSPHRARRKLWRSLGVTTRAYAWQVAIDSGLTNDRANRLLRLWDPAMKLWEWVLLIDDEIKERLN